MGSGIFSFLTALLLSNFQSVLFELVPNAYDGSSIDELDSDSSVTVSEGSEACSSYVEGTEFPITEFKLFKYSMRSTIRIQIILKIMRWRKISSALFPPGISSEK